MSLKIKHANRAFPEESFSSGTKLSIKRTLESVEQYLWQQQKKHQKSRIYSD